VPLLVLSSASPLNQEGVDIVVASPSLCSAYVAMGISPQCDALRRYTLDGRLYYYLGTAAALNMVPADVCAP
jgi:hypothetical protein